MLKRVWHGVRTGVLVALFCCSFVIFYEEPCAVCWSALSQIAVDLCRYLRVSTLALSLSRTSYSTRHLDRSALPSNPTPRHLGKKGRKKKKAAEDIGSELNEGTVPKHVVFRRELAPRLENGTAQNWEVASYIQIYREAIETAQMINVLHVYRSGGVPLCTCAWDSGCVAPVLPKQKKRFAPKVAREEGHCHENGEDGGVAAVKGGFKLQISKKRFDTCDSESEHFRSNSWTFIGDQHYLFSTGLCGQYWNVIIMREPIERLLSQLSYTISTTENKSGLPGTFKSKFIFSHMQQFSDNLYIRMLLGKDIYTLNFGQITETHLKLAKKRLSQFDLVFTTDSLNLDMSKTLRFKCRASEQRLSEQREPLHQRWTEAEWKAVKDQNTLDRQLFQYAIRLHKSDMLVFKHPDFQAALSSPTFHPCLHKKT